MNDLIRPALYQSWQDIKCVNSSSPSTTATAQNSKKYDVVGPICESSDFLARDRELSINEGDLLAIYSSGAYAFAMSSNYNSRNRAAEVIVSDDNVFCVRERETIADQIRLESILPNRL
jgi:diaminopimelate decarboxylase